MQRSIAIFLLLIMFTLALASCGGGPKEDLTKKYPSLYFAVSAGDPTAVKAFLKSSPALVNQPEPTNEFKFTPLALAIACKAKNPEKAKEYQEVIEVLIANGADVNIKLKDNETPLTVAATNGQIASAETLIAKGADIDAAGLSGWTPLHHAVLSKQKEMAEFLIKKGAKINTKDANGDSPLHSASGWGLNDIAELLIAHNADVNAVDNYNKTPLDYAIMKKNKEMEKLLRAKGGKEKSPNTPIDASKVNKSLKKTDSKKTSLPAL